MGLGKDMWIAEFEQVGEDFVNGHISRLDAELTLAQLGHDPHEIKDMLDEYEPQRMEGESNE